MKQILEKIFEKIKREPNEYQAYQDMYDYCREVVLTDKELGQKYLMQLITHCENVIPSIEDDQLVIKLFELMKLCHKQLAYDWFHHYLIYVEWNREPEKKFYEPRMRVLKSLASDLQELAEGRLDLLGVSLPPRVGKLVSDDTPVLTNKGWVNHGDLTLNHKVISPSGEFVGINKIFNKDFADTRVRFTDGSYVDVHENHEWKVYNRHRGKTEILETKAMFEDFENGTQGKRGHRYFYQLPQKQFLKGEFKELPVPPYTLGAWLGDGRNRNPDICGAESDYPIVERILKDGYSLAWGTTHKTTGVKYYGFKGLRAELQSLGMCHSRRTTPKHIPDIYLTATVDQRLELLAGLIDTDGSLVKKEKRYSFSTSDTSLKDGVVSLISTFGWRCSIQAVQPSVSSSGVISRKPHWRIGFNPTLHIPCVLERKKLHEFSKQRKVAICGFDKIPPKPGNCISVDGGMYCVGERLTPTHNSTLCIFFMTWIMGKIPHIANVMSGHSDKLTDGFYREILAILTDKEQYLWSDVFPHVKFVDNSAKNETIDLDRKKRFPTMTCRSISGTLTGAVEIGSGGILYVDDIIEDLEESLNPQRLQAKYDAYLNQLKDRKKVGALELIVGTRWNVFDPLGRIEQQYSGNPRYRFRVISALDENDESNFEYDFGVGFDTAYYHDMRDSIDNATWCAKYMGKPYIREGLLFPEDELLTYNGVLPEGEPEKIAVCDVAWGGGDSLSMPIAYIYGENVYIHDVIFNDGDKTVTYPVVTGRAKQHSLHRMRFEANNGGSEYADKVDTDLRADGVHINIRSKKAPNNQSKLARIIQFAPDIKKFYFLSEKYRNQEYRAFMNELCTFVQTGKNPHDDSPDSLAMLCDELYKGIGKVEVFKRPF